MSPLDQPQLRLQPPPSLEEDAARLAQAYGGLAGEALLRPLLSEELKGRVALVSSFAAPSGPVSSGLDNSTYQSQ